MKITLNRKSFMKFGKWSLAFLPLIILGGFIGLYVIPTLATYPPTQTNDINVTLNTPSDNGYSNSANTNFTFNVSWNANLANITNCTLMGNFTSSWAENSTNTTEIVNNVYNGINNTVDSEGVYIWNIVCYNVTNDVGNYSASNRTVTVDTTNPTSPSNVYFERDPTNYYDDDTTIVVNWTAGSDANGLSHYKIYVSENSGSYSFNGTNNSATGYNFTGAHGNTYRVNVTANDTAGNENTTGAPSNTTITVDTTNPMISVWLVGSSGSSITTAYAANVSIKINVTEDVGVASTEVRIRNTSDDSMSLQWMNWTDAGAEADGSSNYTHSVDAIYIPVGNWTVDVNVTDHAHRSNLSYTFTNSSYVYSYAAIQATAPSSTTGSTTVGGSEITFAFNVIAKGYRYVGTYLNLTAGSTQFLSVVDIDNLYIDTETNTTDRLIAIASDYTSAQTVYLPNITTLPYATANLTLSQEQGLYNDTVTIHINPYSGVSAGTYTGSYGWGLFNSAQ